MTKEERDNLLTYLGEQTNNGVTDCRLKIAEENGRIEGLQMTAAQIARYVRGQTESEDKNEQS